MRAIDFALAGAIIAATGYAVGCDKNSPAAPVIPAAVETLRGALGPFTSLTIAKNAGYSVAITDCMSNGDAGAMGIHFGNPALIDGTADPVKPEALIYEPGTGGEMSLVGVEFIIPFSILPKTSPAPELFGQKYARNETFQVWGLHVWTHRTNPSGLYSAWNPRVHC